MSSVPERMSDDAARESALAALDRRRDELIAEIVTIELEKRRLADEYDAAQERGEVAGNGRPKTIQGANSLRAPSAADVGLNPREIHDARLIRDAEVEAGVWLGPKQAAAFAKKSVKTLRRWAADDPEIGGKVGGRWIFNKRVLVAKITLTR
jgi:hypothetical protein